MIPHAAEIEAVWQQGKRARAEYAAHPFSTWQYGAGCICAWCLRETARNRDRYARRKASA